MSESPADSPAPRRSQREKKQTKPFTILAVENKLAKGKRKRRDSDAEDNITEPEDEQNPTNEDSDDTEVGEEDFRTPKAKAAGRKAKSTTTPKSKGPPPAKKIRATKTTGAKPVKTAVKRGRKLKDDGAYDAAQVTKDTKITADNPLFNAVMNPAAALQSTAEDFLESLEHTPGAALAELINLILRSCGCNDSVNSDEVIDYDGVVDALDNFTEGLKQDDSPIYPLTSKLPVFKKFRKSLSEFIERLIASSADLGILYTSDLMATLQTWVIAMSSSQIRSFRHTATVLALEVETALCDVAASVEKEAEVVGRQREGEKKRKASNKGVGAREKELETKAQEIRGRRTQLAEFLKEFVDGVFVHRYRDFDPNIRAECVRAIGLWFRKYPAHFLDAAYLRYVGWVLSDSNTQVRLEAVKSLSGVYEQTDYIGSLNHFTERFKPRLIEMATGDTELSVRVAVIQVLGALDGHSLLEDEEREKLCLLVFDEEAKVRKAVSHFVRGVWEENVDERLVGKKKRSEDDQRRAGVKSLALLLVKWGKALDNIVGENDSEIGDSHEGDIRREGTRVNKRREVSALVSMEYKSRTALAVEALWEEVNPIRDWQGLLEVLLLDHSATEMDDNEGSSRSVRARINGKTRAHESVVDEAWRLEEIEEGVLLEVFVAALRRAKAEAAGKKGEDETVANDITRELIKGLPRLFIKHQTDQNRIADVLVIPTLMNMDLYLEMRMITGYANLWDDVTKQFLSHSSLNVLTHAMAAIRHFMDATSLSNTNSTKILELEDELSSVLRDSVAGREEIEVASFTEDEVISLSALCTRLAVLAGTRNMTSWIEEDEGGKQSSAWDIINALVERGRLGYKEEETMIEQALHILTLHIIWKGKGLTNDPDPTPEEIRLKESLITQREVLLEKLIEYAVGTQSNTVDGVKRTAFKNLLDLHVLFSSAQATDANGATLPMASVLISLNDEVQYRCAGYIQAEIERYEESLENVSEEEEEEEEDSDADPTSDGEQADDLDKKRHRSDKGKKSLKEVDTTSRTQLEQEYLFIDVMSTFLRAIRAGALHIRHGAILLAHYGQLGPSFDVCSKVVVDVLREEGMMNNHGEVVVDVVVQTLKEAYTLVLDGVIRDENNAFHLSKLLGTCFVIRGSQLSVVRRLDTQYAVQIHTELLSWIAKRLATYESNKNKKSLKLGILFFKVLTPLLSVIQSRDALKIKAHMDQVLAQAKLEVSATSKMWEPQRSYEKRLTTVLSKDKPPGMKKRGKRGGKSAAAVSSDEDASEGERIVDQDEVQNSPPRRRSGRVRGVQPPNDFEQSENEINPKPITPKPKPRPRATHIANSLNNHDPPSPKSSGDQREKSVISDAGMNGVETPKLSRKRARSEEDQSDMDDVTAETGVSRDVPTSQQTSPGDVQIRRKRIRH